MLTEYYSITRPIRDIILWIVSTLLTIPTTIRGRELTPREKCLGVLNRAKLFLWDTLCQISDTLLHLHVCMTGREDIIDDYVNYSLRY